MVFTSGNGAADTNCYYCRTREGLPYYRAMNRLREFISAHPRLAVLTGAGVSTTAKHVPITG